jgi:alcohol dehydrogenase YqhD (iron-dependent ADH family)
MQLILCSKSTEKYARNFSNSPCLIVTKAPDEKIAQQQGTINQAIAIGGGSVIDTAKILCRNRITAIPTTLSGASKTNHAVYWSCKAKMSVKTPFPYTVVIPEFMKTIDEDIYEDTLADCIAHVLESKFSKRKTRNSSSCADLAEYILLSNPTIESALIASLLAGQAIQTTGTNFIHALSYPLTYLYKIPHGRALRYLLTKINWVPSLLQSLLPTSELSVDVDWQLVLSEAKQYPQFYRSDFSDVETKLLEVLT